MTDHQYAIVNGRNVDMDIEDVYDHIFRQQYTDEYLDSIFWVMMETYFTHFPNVKAKYKKLPRVCEMVEDGELVKNLLVCLGIAGDVVSIEDLDEDDVPEEIIEAYPEHTHVAYIQLCGLSQEPTYFTFGVTPAHALVLAFVQYCRETADMHLNLPEGYALN